MADGGQEGGPFVAALEASSWTRQDAELAFGALQTLAFLALVYITMEN